jgi:hypothetical protein
MESMIITSPDKPHEQRKVEKLLLKLAKIKPISAKPAAVVSCKSAILSA